MSLVDELLADLDNDNDQGEIIEASNDKGVDFLNNKSQDKIFSDVSYASVREIASVLDSQELKVIMQEIKKREHQTNIELINLNSSYEYELIEQSNNLTVTIDEDIFKIHKFVKERYKKRFPELDDLIPTALEYLMTVQELGNDLGRSR